MALGLVRGCSQFSTFSEFIENRSRLGLDTKENEFQPADKAEKQISPDETKE
jgi:hypothetical protein